MKRVLFICTGNTCRSPMAEGIFKSLTSNYDVQSAGLFAFSGDPVAENAVLAVKEYGVDISKKTAAPFSPYMIDDTDYFVCMTNSHKASLLSFGIDPQKIWVLDVSDPFLGSLEVYQECAKEIRQKLILFLDEISETKIREYAAGDEAQIEIIEKECFSDPWSAAAIKDTAEHSGKFFVAVVNEKIIGYGGMQITPDVAYITNIAVSENFRMKKLGSKILNTLINFSKTQNINRISLEVRVSNKPAISLYEKFGFLNEGIRKNFYKYPKEDAFIYTLNIKE